jgi:hypothetical protein
MSAPYGATEYQYCFSQYKPLVAFVVGITACAVVTLPSPFVLRFLTTMGFIIGLLAAGSIEVATGDIRR